MTCQRGVLPAAPVLALLDKANAGIYEWDEGCEATPEDHPSQMSITSKRAVALATVVALATTVAVGFVVLVPGILFADPPVSFPGLESGAREASDRGLAGEVNASSSVNGLTLKLTGLIADETQTVISYAVAGREAERNAASDTSATVLVDTEGNSHRPTRGSADQVDRRRGTWVFPPIPAKAGTLAVVVKEFDLYTPRQPDLTMTTVPGPWKVEFRWDGKKAPPGPPVDVPAIPQAFGRGSIRIDSITQAATGTVVSGSLEGFSAEAIQNMDCPAAELETADGTLVGWIECRLGFGEGYRSFEINYPPTSGKVKFNFVLSFSSHGPPGEPALPPELRSDEGARATFDLELPAR